MSAWLSHNHNISILYVGLALALGTELLSEMGFLHLSEKKCLHQSNSQRDDTYKNKNKFGHRFDNIIESDYRGTIGIALRQSIIALPRTRKRSVNKVWPFLTILKKLYIHANNYMLNYHSNAIPISLQANKCHNIILSYHSYSYHVSKNFYCKLNHIRRTSS